MTDSSKLESVKSLQEARHRISNRDKTKIKLNNQKLKDSLVQSMGEKGKIGGVEYLFDFKLSFCCG